MTKKIKPRSTMRHAVQHQKKVMGRTLKQNKQTYETIALYEHFLKTKPFFGRLKYCWSIITCSKWSLKLLLSLFVLVALSAPLLLYIFLSGNL